MCFLIYISIYIYIYKSRVRAIFADLFWVSRSVPSAVSIQTLAGVSGGQHSFLQSVDRAKFALRFRGFPTCHVTAHPGSIMVVGLWRWRPASSSSPGVLIWSTVERKSLQQLSCPLSCCRGKRDLAALLVPCHASSSAFRSWPTGYPVVRLV